MLLTRKDNKRDLILSLGMKYCFEKDHAMKVEKAAVAIFDYLKGIFGLEERERTLLSHAALLHDIGDFISKKKHHKHSKYIIDTEESLDIYNEKDRILLSLIAFNHRKKLHRCTMLLAKSDKDTVIKMSSILRVADAVDFDRGNTEIRAIRQTGNKIILEVEGEGYIGTASRLYTKSKLFRDTFGLEVEIENLHY
ncbi:MAG TPA: HD domain-containing protein [Clostridia bacterium]